VVERAVATLLCLATCACAHSASVIPLPQSLIVTIGVYPHTLLDQLEPIPSGNIARQSRLTELFEEAGCQQLEQRPVGGEGPPYVMCTLPGETSSTVLVSANFDQPFYRSVSANWTGAAMLPTLYRSIRVVPRRHTYAFIGFSDGSKRLLRGSTARASQFLERLPDEERKRVVAMVNLKGFGLGVPSVWASDADPNLKLDLHSVSRSLELPMRRVSLRRNAADLFSLRKLQIPSILIGVADLEVGEYLDSFRLVAAYLGYLDQTLVLRRNLQSSPAARPMREGGG
jgi:hypothetical protein